MWTIAFLVGLGVLLGGLMLVSAQKLRALQREAERISTEVFVDAPSRPAVTVGRAYGYPTFQVAFSSKGALSRANDTGLQAAFLAAIQGRFKASGSKKYPFDASRAVWFTSQEELDAISRIGREQK
ncbi:MAG: hypothetical protein AB7T07_06870 [Steroidobacteraceae bacterium]